VGEDARLWLVTRGAQPVDTVPMPLAVERSPMWGLARVSRWSTPAGVRARGPRSGARGTSALDDLLARISGIRSRIAAARATSRGQIAISARRPSRYDPSARGLGVQPLQVRLTGTVSSTTSRSNRWPAVSGAGKSKSKCVCGLNP
jgi:hypothetical protein